MDCRICNNSENNDIYETREMMFGYRDRFRYFQCSQCECLQLAEIPSDMSKYYPSGYYSFSCSPSIIQGKNALRQFIRKMRDTYAVCNKGVIGKLIYMKFPYDTLRSLSEVGLTKNSNIVDVGCGTGSLLYALREIGFTNTLGIDPYLKENIKYKNGLEIVKKSIHDLGGKWDLVMFHHSFEHVPDPFETIQSASKVLTENGLVLMRIPLVSSYAWEHYGVHWVQLDAPRHFFLHSLKSIKILATKVNLSVKKITYDSTDFQFWGSEQYRKDIPLQSNRSYCINPSNSIFSGAEIKEFKRKAQDLNSGNRGDQAVIYLHYTNGNS